MIRLIALDLNGTFLARYHTHAETRRPCHGTSAAGG